MRIAFQYRKQEYIDEYINQFYICANQIRIMNMILRTRSSITIYFYVLWEVGYVRGVNEKAGGGGVNTNAFASVNF